MKKQHERIKKVHAVRQPNAKKLVPAFKKEIVHLLNSEEAKVSTKGLVAGAITLFSIGMATESLASHGSWHQSAAPHSNTAPHHSYDTGHTSVAPHHSTSPHVSVAPHNSYTTPHVNTHANVNESVTKGNFHNNATDGYGKHTSSLGHNNNPNVHANTGSHTNTAPHYSYNAHTNVAPHYNGGHHANTAPHQSIAPHHNEHNSHGSHGQW